VCRQVGKREGKARSVRGVSKAGVTMARKIVPYKPALKEIARRLRNNSTLGEVLLWKKMSNKQMLGYDFHRQKPLDQFVVDFFCHELNLAIEIDGGSHEADEAQEKDAARQERLCVRYWRQLTTGSGQMHDKPR